jgi:hypothetical protein
MAFQLLRGTNTKVGSYVGQEGEMVYNTTNKSIHILDGVTAGGFEVKPSADVLAEVIGGASAAMDTMKEVEDWIAGNDLTAIVADVNDLKTKVGAIDLTALETRVADIETALGRSVDADGNVTFNLG